MAKTNDVAPVIYRILSQIVNFAYRDDGVWEVEDWWMTLTDAEVSAIKDFLKDAP